MEAVLYVTIGFIASVSGGFWGLGGGWMIVPSLLLFGVDVQTVAAASLFQMAISSFWTVYKQFPKIGWEKGGWGWKAAFPFCTASFIAGFFGESASAFLKNTFKSEVPHQLLFLCILVWIFISIFKKKPVAGDAKNSGIHSATAKSLIASGAGLFTGMISSIIGIGGGVMTRPVMISLLSVPEKTTGMITRFIVLLTGISGTVSYLCLGNVDGLNVITIGLMLATGGIPGFIIGAKMHELVLKSGRDEEAHRSFAIIVLLVIAGMVCKVTGMIIPGRVIISISGVMICIFLTWTSFRKR